MFARACVRAAMPASSCLAIPGVEASSLVCGRLFSSPAIAPRQTPVTSVTPDFAPVGTTAPPTLASLARSGNALDGVDVDSLTRAALERRSRAAQEHAASQGRSRNPMAIVETTVMDTEAAVRAAQAEYAARIRAQRAALRARVIEAYQAVRDRPRFAMSSLLAIVEACEGSNVALYAMSTTPSAAGHNPQAPSRLLVYATCPNEEVLYLAADTICRLAMESGVITEPPTTVNVHCRPGDPWIIIDLGTAIVQLTVGSTRAIMAAEAAMEADRVSAHDYDRFAAGAGDNVPFTGCLLLARAPIEHSFFSSREFTVSTMLKDLEQAAARGNSTSSTPRSEEFE